MVGAETRYPQLTPSSFNAPSSPARTRGLLPVDDPEQVGARVSGGLHGTGQGQRGARLYGAVRGWFNGEPRESGGMDRDDSCECE